jgi:hypothetical protein
MAAGRASCYLDILAACSWTAFEEPSAFLGFQVARKALNYIGPSYVSDRGKKENFAAHLTLSVDPFSVDLFVSLTTLYSIGCLSLI